MRIIIPQFNKVVNDPRTIESGAARMIANFDVFTDPARMTPYRASESGDSSSSTSQKQNFTLGYWTPTPSWRVFSLGVKSGTGLAEVLMKSIGTGSSNDLSDSSWATPSNNQSSSGSTSFNLFVHYKTKSKIYGASGGTSIWAFSTAGSAWDDNVINTESSASVSPPSYTNIAQGIVHSQDDILYIPYDNKIMSNNNGTWTVPALTLPAQYYITSICEYGDKLAIAAAPLSSIGKSRVYLWDRKSVLFDVSANIDWGDGLIQVLEEIDGYLIGISSIADVSRTRYRIVFRYYAGASGAIKFAEFTTTTGPWLRIAKQKIDNRIYFSLNITLNGTKRAGVWSLSKSDQGFHIVLERTFYNDTTLTSDYLGAFYIVGDYTFIVYVDDQSDYQLSKTNDQAVYTASSIVETTINPGMPLEDRSAIKNVKYVAATFEPLGSSGSVTIYYRRENDSSWTSLIAMSTQYATIAEIQNDADRIKIKNGREYEFKIVATGGAVLTSFIYDYDVIQPAL